ncbi:receptor-like protein kinase HERK 1 [Spinacia oleracea]|uniref:Receptor-like protein kinase HERK 1 n=1 Tax=Spinacia oleracea TaxID=3562 RepID=A0ABM3QTQ7_SPIOL|nr:receptor-like protein kinase HERK 1 [Spinacia oleracea]XP_056686751.1 receptor-like protein kinase HERK 1 [Spinacia oleracea]
MGYKDGLVSCIMVLCLVCLAYRVYADSYLIDCGATSNTTIGNRVFLADRYAAKYLSTRPNILVKTLSENNLLYHTARVFRNLTSYTFPISQTGRYFIRFHFFPFTSKSYDLSSAKFMVFAQQFKLLNEFSPPKVSVVKEYSVLVNTNRLTILIVPTVNSIAFLNAIEVFLVPDSVTTDYATLINPLPGYKDLVTMALETFYRVNMGGSNIDFDGDKFWRSWIQDDRFLEQKDLSIDIHKYGAANSSGLVAPLVVYESCRELNSQNDIIANVSWNFSVNRGFQYSLRFHYCDIVSTSPDELYFNVYVDSLMISEDLDLTSLAKGSLDTPVYLDYITPELTTNTLRVSIGPTAGAQNQPNAILNG